jgi:hypothetical protein
VSVMFTSHPGHHARWQSIAALVLTIALYAVFLMLLLSDGFPTAPAGPAAGDSSLVVEFIGISPIPSLRSASTNTAKQSVNELRAPPSAVEPSSFTKPADSSRAIVLPDRDDLSQKQHASDKVSSKALPASAASASTHGSPRSATDGYLMAVRQAISTRWAALHPDEPLPACMLRIQQATGGAVTSAQASNCAIDATKRSELEAAALMAQPLPYIGYEQSFSDDLTLAF